MGIMIKGVTIAVFAHGDNGAHWEQYIRMLVDGDYNHAEAYADDHGLDV